MSVSSAHKTSEKYWSEIDVWLFKEEWLDKSNAVHNLDSKA